MQQQPGGGQFGGSNQPNYYMPAPSPYQQQQGTPMSSFVHSPGSSLDPTGAGGGYHHQQPQQPQTQAGQQIYQYGTMAPSPASHSELSRHLGFGSAPPSVGSPIPAGSGGGFRSQPPSLQQMLPPTPQPPTPRGGPASVGPIGMGDYNVPSVGGPATPRSVGEPLSVSDQHQQQMMSTRMAGSASGGSLAAALLDQDSNSQMDSPQQQQHQNQQHFPGSATSAGHIQDQTGSSRNDPMPSFGTGRNDQQSSGANVGGKGQSMGSSMSGTVAAAAAQVLQNLDQYGPLALCSTGKELTQELVNRTADMLMLLRAMTDPMQQFPKTISPELVQQLNDKQRRLSDSLRQTAALMHRLFDLCGRLEQFSKERLPVDAETRIKELIPYTTDGEDPANDDKTIDKMEIDQNAAGYLTEIRLKAEEREEYQQAHMEHEKIKQELMKKREHLKKIMEFLREFCWEISAVVGTKSANQ